MRKNPISTDKKIAISALTLKEHARFAKGNVFAHRLVKNRGHQCSIRELCEIAFEMGEKNGPLPKKSKILHEIRIFDDGKSEGSIRLPNFSWFDFKEKFNYILILTPLLPADIESVIEIAIRSYKAGCNS